MSASPLHQPPHTYRAFYGAFPALRPFQIAAILPRTALGLELLNRHGRPSTCASAVSAWGSQKVMSIAR